MKGARDASQAPGVLFFLSIFFFFVANVFFYLILILDSNNNALLLWVQTMVNHRLAFSPHYLLMFFLFDF